MDRASPILVTGANGFVGANLVDYLRSAGFLNVNAVSHKKWNLDNLDAAMRVVGTTRPQYVFHLAAYVNGIAGNMRNQGKAFLENLRINTNVIEACQLLGVEKIVAMGTVAMYPQNATDFYLERDLWNGPPHESEKGYAHAKRAMLAQLETSGVRFAMPICTNLYGPNDRFDIENGHCIPSMVRKAFEAGADKNPMTVWGDGSACRDFLYVEDACRALHCIMDEMRGR